MPTVIDELVTILGMDVSPSVMPTVKKFTGFLDDITKSAAWTSAGIIAAASSMLFFSQKSNATTAELAKFEKLTGIASKTIQEWGFAAEQVGGNSESLTNDLMSLTKSMSSPIPGEFNNALLMIGISVKDLDDNLKSADDILLEVSDKFQGMTAQRQLQWGSKLGISNDTILLLQKGRDGIDMLRKEANNLPLILTKEQTKSALDFTIQMKKTSQLIDYFTGFVAAETAPTVEKLVDRFTNLIIVAEDFTKSKLSEFVDGIALGFEGFIDTIDSVIDSVDNMFPGLKSLIDMLTSTEVTSTTVKGALLILAGVLAFLAAKYLLIASVVALAGLAIDDFLTYLDGGESLIGDFIGMIEKLWSQFGEKFPAIAGIIEAFGGVLAGLGNIIKNNFISVLDLAWDSIKVLGEGVSWLFGMFDNILQKTGISKVADQVSEAVQGFGHKKGLLGDTRFTAPSVPVAAKGDTNTTTMQTTQVKNEISLQVIAQSTDPQGIAKETMGALDNAMHTLFPGSLAPATQ